MAEITTLYLDLQPTNILFAITTTKADGTKESPSVDALIIYEENGANLTQIVAANEIANSPFDPVNIPTDAGKTGLWSILVPKSNFTAGKYYICYWEMTVDGVATHKVEIYFFINSVNVKADVSNLDAAITTRAPSGEYDTEMGRIDVILSTRSSHNAAAIWAAAGRELSTPNNYKANVSALALEATLEAAAIDIIAEINVNEGKIDIIDDVADSILTLLGTVDGKMDTAIIDIASNLVALTSITNAIVIVDANVDLILADSNELQTDWKNGGRLDLLIDLILGDSNEIQGKLPANNIMGSSVKTDKDDEIDSIKATLEAMDVKIDALAASNDMSISGD